MFFSEDAYAPRAARAKELAAELSADGVRFVEMQLPDINGMMRGKIATVDKGLEDCLAQPTSVVGVDDDPVSPADGAAPDRSLERV